MKKFVSTNVATIVLIAAFALVSFTSTTGKADEKLNTTRVETTAFFTSYVVITGTSARDLEDKMYNYKSSGWNLQGGVSHADGVYAQALSR